MIFGKSTHRTTEPFRTSRQRADERAPIWHQFKHYTNLTIFPVRCVSLLTHSVAGKLRDRVQKFLIRPVNCRYAFSPWFLLTDTKFCLLFVNFHYQNPLDGQWDMCPPHTHTRWSTWENDSKSMEIVQFVWFKRPKNCTRHLLSPESEIHESINGFFWGQAARCNFSTINLAKPDRFINL